MRNSRTAPKKNNFCQLKSFRLRTTTFRNMESRPTTPQAIDIKAPMNDGAVPWSGPRIISDSYSCEAQIDAASTLTAEQLSLGMSPGSAMKHDGPCIGNSRNFRQFYMKKRGQTGLTPLFALRQLN